MKFKFDWGAAVVAIIIGMLLFLGTLVFIATRQNFYLVDEDYYERGVAYQQQIEKIENTNTLSKKIDFSQQNDELVLVFPPEMINEKLEGTIHLYNPVNKSFDFLTPVRLDINCSQVIKTENMEKGRYTVKVDWKTGAKSYYQEENINIR